MASRARREEAEAQLAELRLREQTGELVRADAVRTAMVAKVLAFRDALVQIPLRIVPIIAAETDPLVIHGVLDEQIAAALRMVAESPYDPELLPILAAGVTVEQIKAAAGNAASGGAD